MSLTACSTPRPHGGGALDELAGKVLQETGESRVIVRACRDHPKRLVHWAPVGSQAEPRTLSGFPELEAYREQNELFALTLTILRYDEQLVSEAVENFPEVESELNRALEADGGELYLVYAVSHVNEGPAGPLTIFIGGDCYRRDRLTITEAVDRSRDLARAMVRKAVLIFPDIAALHGGKKGEWLLVRKDGTSVEAMSDQAVVALGVTIIPRGIRFLNERKFERARELGAFDSPPEAGLIHPDTGSPDVLSGPNWYGMTHAWSRRGWDLRAFTCIPEDLGGPPFSSSRPTGYGVATTAVSLARHRFPERSPAELGYLVEAVGGVSFNVIEALIHRHGVPPQQIFAFDPKRESLQRVVDFGVRTEVGTNRDLYDAGLKKRGPFDVWINNGLGDDVGIEQIRHLLDAGVRVFCGGANNFLALDELEASLQAIFENGAIAWPDEATSGGGWTMAVMDLYKRCQGQESSSPQWGERILNIIEQRNVSLIEDVLGSLDEDARSTGLAIWEGVERILEARVEKAMASDFGGGEGGRLLDLADVRSWRLEREG